MFEFFVLAFIGECVLADLAGESCKSSTELLSLELKLFEVSLSFRFFSFSFFSTREPSSLRPFLAKVSLCYSFN